MGLACAAACGGAAPGTMTSHEIAAFDCRKRTARYVATHHMSGGELGVQIDCAEDGPRIKRWRVDSAGTRQEDAHSLSPGEFDTVWREIEGTGWRYLRNCTNGTPGKRTPIYAFEIRDDQNHASFVCQSQSMPYPYNDIVDPLDLAAQDGRRELGEPGGDDDQATTAKAHR